MKGFLKQWRNIKNLNNYNLHNMDYIEYEDVEAVEQQHQEEIIYYENLQRTASEIFEQGLRKNEIQPIVDILVNNVLEHGNPLVVAENAKVLEEIIEKFKKDKRYKDY